MGVVQITEVICSLLMRANLPSGLENASLRRSLGIALAMRRAQILSQD